MTGALWSLVIITGVSTLLAALGRRRVEEWFAPAIVGVVALMYAFALAGALEWGCRIARALGLGCLGAAAVLAAKRREARGHVFTPGMLAFAAVALAAWWAHRGQLYTLYDEFSHWGRIVNRMHVLGALPNATPGALDFPDYPPGAALWEYLWTWMDGGFSEGMTVSANNVWIAACFLPLMRYADWRHWKRIVPTLLVCVMLPMPFYTAEAYQNIYVDVLLGAMASYALIQWFTLPEGWERTLMTGAAMFALPLIKESGAFIALLVILILALDLRCERRGEGLRRFWALGVQAACVAVSLLSWKIYLGAHDIVGGKPFRIWEIGENISMFLSGTSPAYQRSLFSNFFRFLTMPQMMGAGHILQLCYLEWAMALVLVACWLGRRSLGNAMICARAKRRGRAVATAIGVTAIYAVCLAHLYLYAFSEAEAASLHSFDRYMASIMIPALALAVALMMEEWRDRPPRIIPASLAVLAMLMLVAAPSQIMNLTFAAPAKIVSTQEWRSARYPPEWVLGELEGSDRVAWLTGGHDSEDAHLTYTCNRYEFMPVVLDNPCGSLVKGTADEVRAALKTGNYGYVYCFDADDAFAQEYGGLFEAADTIADKTLYRVVSQKEGIMLRRVE